MYKLVAIDLDGTLLNSYGVVTEYTKQILNEISKKGIEVVLASGRPIDSIKTIANEIGGQNYFIAGNGALIYDLKKNEIIYEKYMSKEKVLEIIEICEQNSISYNVYTEKTILSKSLQYNVLYYHKENLKKEEDKKTKINIVDNIYEYIQNMENGKFLKITVCDNDKSIFNSIIRKLKKIENIDILDVSHMSRKTIRDGSEEFQIEYFYTEISSKNVNKWDAILHLIEKLNIKSEEVVAIGDNINDKKMIMNSGLGISMFGSTQQIIEYSDYVTDTNNNEGVAKALKKFKI